MKRLSAAILANVFGFCLAGAALAQDTSADRATVPLTDPSRPGTVKVNLLSGGITVKGYSGKEVIVEARGSIEERSRGRNREESQGLKRITNSATGLKIEEEDNVVTVGTSSFNRPVDITIQVPTHTSLTLKSINGGDIKVEQVSGEIEVNDINGGVTLSQVSGNVVAHALNGTVKVSFDSVEPGKPMSFSSLNGNIDVTFPPDVKANLAMKTDQGDIYSDFEISIDPSHKPQLQEARAKGAKYRFEVDKTMYGSINGGGPEMQFKTFNGNIYIRKKAK